MVYLFSIVVADHSPKRNGDFMAGFKKRLQQRHSGQVIVASAEHAQLMTRVTLGTSTAFFALLRGFPS